MRETYQIMLKPPSTLPGGMTGVIDRALMSVTVRRAAVLLRNPQYLPWALLPGGIHQAAAMPSNYPSMRYVTCLASSLEIPLWQSKIPRCPDARKTSERKREYQSAHINLARAEPTITITSEVASSPDPAS